MSESITEDVHTFINDTSSLKLDLGGASERLHSVTTPRAIDSARTLADISEECPPSARTTARDESSVTAGGKLPVSEAAKAANSSRQASVISTGASYSEDFSTVASSRVASRQDKQPSSAQPDVGRLSRRLSEESVPTEDDVSEAALSDDDTAHESIGAKAPQGQNVSPAVNKGSDNG